ncbi:MAG: SdiA-regulated domain-containing protein [Bacteroidota bacterium]
MNEPEEKFFLPYYLAEISGLAYRSQDTLLAIQDEKGILYEFSLVSGDVIRPIKFATPHDFEDVQLVGDSVFVLESNGDIRMFHLSDSVPKKNVVTIDTDLSVKNDTEGLGYDPKSHSLLIACKASGEVNKNHVDGKAVYRLDLHAMELDIHPFFNVTKKDFEKYFEQHKGRDYEADRFRFEPSAIAYNPADQLYYLLASVGKLMVVFDDKGIIRATYSIPVSLLAQPEGLCFSPRGDMYISSEGNGDKGYILRYSIKRR